MTVDVVSAVLVSLKVAAWSTLLGLVPAVYLGHRLARPHSPGRTLITGLVLLPLVLPPVVTGLLLLDLFGRNGAFGAALEASGVRITFSWIGAALAAFVVGMPLYVMATRQAFEAVDPRYAEVAATLGDPPAAAFRRVALPLALPGVAAGAVLAFARALGEFGATIVVAGNVEGETRTVALAVYTLLDGRADDPRLRSLVTASLALAFGAMLAYEALVRWQRRRLERSNG